DVLQVEGEDLAVPLDRLRPLIGLAQLRRRLRDEGLERLVRPGNVGAGGVVPAHGASSSLVSSPGGSAPVLASIGTASRESRRNSGLKAIPSRRISKCRCSAVA